MSIKLRGDATVTTYPDDSYTQTDYDLAGNVDLYQAIFDHYTYQYQIYWYV